MTDTTDPFALALCAYCVSEMLYFGPRHVGKVTADCADGEYRGTFTSRAEMLDWAAAGNPVYTGASGELTPAAVAMYAGTTVCAVHCAQEVRENQDRTAFGRRRA